MPIYKGNKGFFGSIFTKKNALLIIVIVLLVIQYFQMMSTRGMLSDLKEKDSSLITEVGQIKQSYMDFGQNINEVRDYLRLPTSSFNFAQLEAEGGAEADANDDKVQLAMFKYFQHLGTNKNLFAEIDKKRVYLDEMHGDESFRSFILNQGLNLGDLSETDSGISVDITTADGKSLVFYYLSKEDGVLVRRTANAKDEIEAESAEAFKNGVNAFVQSNKDALVESMEAIDSKKSEIAEAIAGTEVQNYLAAEGASISSEAREENLESAYDVKNSAGELIGVIVLDHKSKKIRLVNMEKPADAKTVAGLLNGELLTFLKTLNTASLIEGKVKEAKAAVESTLNDKGFKLLLAQEGLKIAEVREDEDRYYYDILDESGAHLSSIVVEKMTAVINIVEPDGSNSENILFFEPDVKKKTLEIPDQLPEFGDELSHTDGTFNILIAGKHGNLVDTMIFAHVNEKEGTVRMISIPRDLQYNGRKINSFPHFYGMEELKKVLSDMTGYQLDKYILIDMYAFIDVIDLIGGIDVTLENAVIDPTYRTVDNGVVGTLHYEPGDYHLGGKESLRLARSRHTSSDFARAERQQLIIEAIQEKARNFGFGDADTIFEIARTVLSKTETDINLDEAISYYFRYQNFDILSNDVMSSGNVLYSPPYITVANCNAQIAAGGDSGCAGQNHAYILIPRNGNWDLIKWFFKEKFEGTAEEA